MTCSPRKEGRAVRSVHFRRTGCWIEAVGLGGWHTQSFVCFWNGVSWRILQSK